MKPERWPEVQRLFARALEQPEAEREAFVTRECGADPELLSELLRLLRARPGPAFLEPPPVAEEGAGRELGDFTLLEEIGRGGMGVVYRALQRPLQRVVAVKTLPAGLTLTQRQIDRFQREARAAARLQHPNVVAVLTVGAEQGTHYFAMEYVDGNNLAEELVRLRRDLASEGDDHAHLPSSHASDYFRSVAEVVKQAADGLFSAHQHGIVHRDVKPSNLLLDRWGRVKIVDFGLARDEEQGSLSTTGDLAGTPHYMSPEQARAQRHRVDHRTDVYSLGVVLFELLTLKRPYEGRTSREVINNILQRDPPRIRKLNHRVPRDLDTICVTAMAKDPRERYPDAAALRDDLARFLSHEAIQARPPAVWTRLRNHVSRRRSWYVPSAFALAGVGIAWIAIGAWSRRREVLAHIQPLREVVEAEELSSFPVETLVNRLEQSRALRAEGIDASLAAAWVDPAVRRIEEVGEGWKREGLERLRRGLWPPAETPMDEYRAASDPDYFRGLRLLQHALLLLPGDDELRYWTDPRNTYPKLELESAPELRGARVFLQTIDWLSLELSAPVLLGELPLDGPLPVEPGIYRIVVVRDTANGPDFCELSRVLDRRGRVYRLGARLRATSAVHQGMVHVPAGEYVVGRHVDARPHLGARRIRLPGFWIDLREVTNGEYRRFLSAIGREPPLQWPEEYRPEWDDLPVVGVDPADALAYAEWAGKRLPTYIEWEAAARGPGGFLYPWGNETGSVERILGRPRRDELGLWDQYLAGVHPVGAAPEDEGPFGLRDTLGNVMEWTETVFPDVTIDGEPYPDYGSRVVKGLQWDTPALLDRDLAMMAAAPVVGTSNIGFRCAKSEWRP